MGKITDFEAERKKYNRKKRIKGILWLIVLAAIIVVIYAFRVDIAAQGLGVMVSDSVSYFFDNNGFPIKIDSAPKQLDSVGRRAVLLTESSLSCYNSAGNEIIDKRTVGKSVVAVTKGRYMMTFERGGFEVEIRNGDTVVYTHRFTEPIYCADIAENGAFAVSTGVVGALSQVISFDSNYSQQFKWLSTERIIYSLSLDKNARYIAAGGIGLNQGVLDSAVWIFELENGNERANIDMRDEMLLKIRLFEDSSATVITDKSVRAISASGKLRGEYSFDGEEITAFDIAPNGESAVAVGNFEELHEQRLVRLNSKAEPVSKCRSANKTESIFVYGEDTLAFVGERVIRFDINMGRVASTETPEAVMVAPAGKYLYYSTVDELYRAAIK